MTRTPAFRFILLSISLIMLSGCMSANKPMDLRDREVHEKPSSKLESLRITSDSKTPTYRRQLALSFGKTDQILTVQHEKIIRLFFQTLPAEININIIISVAPASDPETFKALQNAWHRLRSLKQEVSSYSDNIKLIYKPELQKDTAILQVEGGKRV